MYWTRKELKDRAKQVLRTSYWKAFLVSLVVAVLSGGVSGCSFNSSGGSSLSLPGLNNSWGDIGNSSVMAVVVIGAILLALVVGLLSVAFQIFIVAPFEAGEKQYFKQAAAQNEINMSYLVYAFTNGNYLRIVLAMLWSGFLLFLWYCLLIIPGIVKSYAYGMVPYLLGDNPQIGSKRAVELSNQMTQGHKWKMFVLDLSFIGWYVLGTLALGIGVLFVTPYYQSTRAELYLVLREQALHKGLSHEKELNLL
ncbi:hypothetical protein BC351_12535 [Paenibacillus ferrarius]|uniref:DUF975 domain-containing protein n=1 Tax=Paenibacillus ferrarius TaxID=1469647 RepID=A0A1V4H6K8_9BACL|nr:DUF975 family protein [Paenibacillus ferrarius]OPH46762.1 hypothetical protein BC351_12535 [Paenibacillus ferrarius]